jgi:hypothetical protein
VIDVASLYGRTQGGVAFVVVPAAEVHASTHNAGAKLSMRHAIVSHGHMDPIPSIRAAGNFDIPTGEERVTVSMTSPLSLWSVTRWPTG